MFPPQTSLIPVTVSLSKFLEAYGLKAFELNYPYWYLGTTPFRFLSGPVILIIINLIHKILPFISLFTITICFVLLSFLISSIGWSKLSKEITGEKRLGLLIFFLTLFFPWRYLSALAVDEATFVIARNLIPFILLFIYKYLVKPNNKIFFISVLNLLIIFLISTDILPQVLIGIISISFAVSFEKNKFKNWEKQVKKSIVLLIIGICFVTLWYSPSYWITILFNPSIGGVSLPRILAKIIELARSLLPICLAVFSVFFFKKLKNKFTVFALIWISSFAFISFFRFISNPNFWMDWTSWFFELEIGIAFIIAIYLNSKRYFIPVAVLFLSILSFLFFYQKLGAPIIFSKTPPLIVENLEKVKDAVKDKRVFLSGSTVFWADDFYDINQVRGGKDTVAVNSVWYKGAWEIREGTNPQTTKDWLRRLGVSFVLVHTEKSQEFYHDFKNLSKWERIGKKIWEEKGDILYAIN